LTELGKKAIDAVGRLLEAHRDEGDLGREAELNDEIIRVCELLDYYQRLSEVRCKPLATLPQRVQVIATLQAMTSPELKPFVRAARELGREDKKNGGKFSMRRLAAAVGYEKQGRTHLANIEKRHRQYSYNFRAYLKACYDSERNPSIDLDTLRAAPPGQRLNLLRLRETNWQQSWQQSGQETARIHLKVQEPSYCN
jgi:hypothetical protein